MGDSSSPLLPADSPAVMAHINLLQGIINRLANNSASCKTWCLALVGALLSLAGATHSPVVAYFTIVPVLIFGFVDTMYLTQETAYRALYGGIVTSVRQQKYKLDDAFEARAPWTSSDVCHATKSWSIWPIYGGLIVIYIVASIHGWTPLLTVAAKVG